MKNSFLKSILILSLYLGLHNGYIALWNTEQPEPLHVFPYKAALFPKIDRNALEEGIPLDNAEHLNKLLEDFLS